MENNSKLKKYLWVVIIILVIAGVVYLLALRKLNSTPYKVLTPESYPAGTVVSLYKGTPPGFPREVIAENEAFNYSGSVVNPEGKAQISVSYISSKSMEQLVALYEQSLPSVGWNVTEKNVYEKVSILKAAKKDKTILISIAPIKDKGVMVTFQYEK